MVGYAAIVHALQLAIPVPRTVSIVSRRNRKYVRGRWAVYPVSYLPDDGLDMPEMEALFRQLVFALKYEGVNLPVFKKLVAHYSFDQLGELVQIEPTGQYSRRIWFLIEWLGGRPLPARPDLSKKAYVKLVDESLQYAVEGVKSPRHLVINNLPGTVDFCPLVHKTPKLEQYIQSDLAGQQNAWLQGISKEVMQRASAFLLLKDSKASFAIEGESPKSVRAARWSKALGAAGATVLSHEELLRLQRLVIENPRFLQMGYRRKGGFVGEHDRDTGEPVPDHISAKRQDVEPLMQGVLDTVELLIHSRIDAVICAAVVAFGFVYIHPFEDGNGRLHRYLMHYVLTKKKFSPQGVIFPVSAAILNNVAEYRAVLESYSTHLLDFIEWKEAEDHNVEVLNDTIDYYRYFDATPHAEFLYDCVNATVHDILPREVAYLIRYDTFKKQMLEKYAMPEQMVALLLKFLEQHGGKLSERAREKEFAGLKAAEATAIEAAYRAIFRAD